MLEEVWKYLVFLIFKSWLVRTDVTLGVNTTACIGARSCNVLAAVNVTSVYLSSHDGESSEL